MDSVDFTGKKILLIDDDEDLADAIETNLSLSGADVAVAHNGFQGLQALESTHFNVVVSDIRMPECDGPTFLKLALEKYEALPPVFFMTGYSEYNEKELVEQGAAGVLMKPFGVEMLYELLKNRNII